MPTNNLKIAKAKLIINKYDNFKFNFKRGDLDTNVFLSICKKIDSLHLFIKENTPTPILRKKVAKLRKLVKKIETGYYKNNSRYFKLKSLITIYKVDKDYIKKEDNVWEWSNNTATFTAQYTIGKNGKTFFRTPSPFYKHSWTSWKETDKILTDEFKKECNESFYINHRC